MSIPNRDREVLVKLAERVAELSETKDNAEKKELWRRTTDLEKGLKPALLVHLFPPVAWSEALPEQYECVDEMARKFERNMKERIWTIENLHDDSVIEPVIEYENCVDIIPYREFGELREYTDGDDIGKGACKFIPSIINEEDIEKISAPIINVDFVQREANRLEAADIFNGILTVVPKSTYFAAKVVDEYVALRGMDRTYMDMMDNPDWLKQAFSRIATNFKQRFKTLEQLGVWGSWYKSEPLGSTGLRFNSDIPNYDEIVKKGYTTLDESWAFTCSEGFTCVSPDMHTEFALEHDKELMKLFKYVNVGCCEVLSSKIDYVKAVNNVRRISISEWCDFEKAGQELGDSLVYGYKPSGVPFVGNKLNERDVREELKRVLEASKGCVTEIVLNIGGTLDKGNPSQKLVDWTLIAKDEINKMYS